jgi:hypothetical protein
MYKEFKQLNSKQTKQSNWKIDKTTLIDISQNETLQMTNRFEKNAKYN